MYVIIREFQPKYNTEKQFETAYGPQGVWAALFKKGKGYISTDLLHDMADPARYLTIDRWTSRSLSE